MDKPIVFMFPGQGSHYFHMGRAFYLHYPTFRKWVDEGEKIVKKMIGKSLLSHLFNPARKRGEPLDELIFTHPALFIFEYAMVRLLLEHGIKPDILVGVSLGEFIAMSVAGGLSFSDALTSIILQAEIIKQTCRQGKMIAIMADAASCFHEHIMDAFEVAAINCDNHFVISMLEGDDASTVLNQLQNENIIHQALDIKYGFHSRHIDTAKEKFYAHFKALSFNQLALPLMSSAKASALSDIVDITHFWQVMRNPIQFKALIHHMEALGAYQYIDLGPSTTLDAFVKNNLTPQSQSEIYSTYTLFGDEVLHFEETINKISRVGCIV